MNKKTSFMRVDKNNFVMPYVIAEIGSNHCGSLHTAKQLIDVAVDAGADCVKFQSVSISALYSKYDENLKRAVDEITLTEDWHFELHDYCARQNIAFTSTPTYIEAARLLVRLGVPFLKIASLDLNNLPFLQELTQLKVPLVISRGMGTMTEIAAALDVLKQSGPLTDHAILHCVSLYPAAASDLNLAQIRTLDQLTEATVGFSDHSESTALCSAAYVYGARIFEKHITLDRSLKGFDHFYALEPREFKEYVTNIRDTAQAIGTSYIDFNRKEQVDRDMARRSLVAARDIEAGEIISKDLVKIVRPASGGMEPKFYDFVMGLRAQHVIRANEQIQLKDLK